MKPDRWEKLDGLFHAVLALEPAGRAGYLDEVCVGDEVLRGEVEVLLAASEKAGSFIEKPAMEVAARLAAQDPREAPTTMMVGKTIGHYRIIALLGAGGMGEVFLAQDTRLGRKVALKILPASLTNSADRLRRFEQEARTASALNHPNIVTIHEVGMEGSNHFIAQEFIDGITLRDHAAGQRLAVSEALDVALQIASALSAAHAKGIVHRDIKPENVMLDRGSQGLGANRNQVKVLDFGIAKINELSKTEPHVEATTRILLKTDQGLTIGTAPYMSPEQARGESVDGRSDIWSLGVVLHEMLSGKQPFAGDTAQDVIAAILRDPVPTLSPEVPESLKWIVKKALRKDPEERYQTAKELFSDLRDSLLIEDPNRKPKAEHVLHDAESDLLQSSKQQPPPGRTRVKSYRPALFIGFLVLVALVIGIVALKYLRSNKSASRFDFDAAKLTRLTSNGKAAYAAISPDGKYVVHVTEDAGKQSLWLRHVATSSDQEIVTATEDGLSQLTFSPDGNYIYYTRIHTGQPFELHQITVLGGADRKLISDIDSNITFSPDGKRIAFLRGDPVRREASLIVALADGSDEQKLATKKITELIPVGPSEFGPAWSPDGEVIVVSVNIPVPGDRNVVLMAIRVKDKTETQISPQRWLRVGQICWLGDGNGLLLSANDGSSGLNRQIWQVSYPGGDARKVTNDLADYRGLSVTADSSALVTVHSDRRSNIWLATNEGAGEASQITSNKSDGWLGMDWTPDGRIVYASQSSGNSEIWIVNADGSGVGQLTSSTFVNGLPSASLDGRYIAFSSYRSGKTNVWRIDIDGRNLKQLTSGNSDFSPKFAFDSQSVIFTSNESEYTVVAKVPVVGGDIVPLTNYPARVLAVAPRDGLIAINDLEDLLIRRVAAIPPSGGRPTIWFDPKVPIGMNARWTTDGRALSYVVTQRGVSNVWNLPVDGSAPQKVTDFKSDRIFYFAWSLDGKSLALSRGTLTNDVVLINFKTR